MARGYQDHRQPALEDIIKAMDEVLQKSDFISLDLPLLPETRGRVNDKFLGKVKAGAYLVSPDCEPALVRAMVASGLDVMADALVPTLC